MAKVQIIYEKPKSYWPIFQMNAIRAKLHIIYKDHNMATRITLDNAYRGRRTKPPHPDATTTRATPETMKPPLHQGKAVAAYRKRTGLPTNKTNNLYCNLHCFLRPAMPSVANTPFSHILRNALTINHLPFLQFVQPFCFHIPHCEKPRFEARNMANGTTRDALSRLG